MKSLLVDVTKADIEEARRVIQAFNDAIKAGYSAGVYLPSEECPMAQAIKRQTECRSVYVQGRWASIEGIPFLLSERAQQWVARYDKKGKSTPARFQIRETTFPALRGTK